MRAFLLLFFSGLFGLFSMGGDQFAFQIEKKIFQIKNDLEQIDEALAENLYSTSLFYSMAESSNYEFGHSQTMRFLKQLKVKFEDLKSLIPEGHSDTATKEITKGIELFTLKENKNLNEERWLERTKEIIASNVDMLADFCERYAHEDDAEIQVCPIYATTQKEIKEMQKNLDLGLFDTVLGDLVILESRLGTFQVGHFNLLQQKQNAYAKLGDLNFKRQLALVFAVLNGLLSLLSILLYFRLFFRDKFEKI